jgi:hypothetical protein
LIRSRRLHQNAIHQFRRVGQDQDRTARGYRIALCLLLGLFANNALATESSWPKIHEFEVNFIVHTNAEKIEFIKPLYDLRGTLRYTFVCRGGSTEYLDKLGEQKDINYVERLGCTLNLGTREDESSLLAEDDVDPWHTRGQYFSFDEVIGDCGNYPEYGRIRHFRLRGFELTLSAIEPVYNEKKQLQSFTMKVSLRRDDRIKSKYTEQPGYLTPYKEGRNCNQVVKGNEQRMCRDETGSYVPCID